MSSRKKDENGPSPSNTHKGPWFQALKSAMEDPDQVLYTDEQVVIIADKYPKSKYHFLVLPKANIPNLRSVTKDHLKLLKHMHRKGVEFAHQTDDRANFRFGYHALPSMNHLHLHVISQDFSGRGLKHKKHWNSFTTEFFMDSTDVIKQLEEKGKINIPNPKQAEELLRQPLRCHVCDAGFSTMPKLKAHIADHCS